MKISPDPSTVL